MNDIISISAIVALLLLIGLGLGLAQPKRFSLRWLLAATALVALNDLLLTRAYHLIPALFPAAHWNWQGKAMALAATVTVASLPAFGWKRSGLTLAQAKGSLEIVIPVALLYCGVFVALALADHSGGGTAEDTAFQLTMPGLEEEPFYRGVLLLALDRAFAGRVRLFGVEWGWGAVLSCALFGLAHAFGFSHGRFSFEPMTMALTGLPAFLAVWIRLRTGSVLIPVLLHNFGNSISLLV